MQMMVYLERSLLMAVRTSLTKLVLIDPHNPLMTSPISRYRNQKNLFRFLSVRFVARVVVVLKDLLTNSEPEVFAVVQSLEIHSHFGGCHHLHCLRNLSNAINRFHAQLDCFLICCEGLLPN